MAIYSEEDLAHFAVFGVGGYVMCAIWILQAFDVSTPVITVSIGTSCISAFVYWVKYENAKIAKEEEAAMLKAGLAKAKNATGGAPALVEAKKDK